MAEHKSSAATQWDRLPAAVRLRRPAQKAVTAVVVPPPEMPPAIEYLWHWFRDVERGIDGSGFSQPCITWRDVEAWARLMRHEIAPREASMIICLGQVRATILGQVDGAAS